MKRLKISDFENLLDVWKGLYILDDVFYLKAISELSKLDFNIEPKHAYSFLIRFLELWGVRRTAINISPEELSHKILQLKPLLVSINTDLLHADLQIMGVKAVKIFKEICDVKNVGSTSASKILHLLRPKFFVMWDYDIAKEYHVEMSPKGYLKFLMQCQSLLKSILEEYRKSGIEDPEAYLSSKYRKPLTKLLDEYNWLSSRKWLSRIHHIT